MCVVFVGCVCLVNYSNLGLFKVGFVFELPISWGAAGRAQQPEPNSYLVYLKYTDDGYRELVARKMSDDDIDFIVLFRVSVAGRKFAVVSTRELHGRLAAAAAYYNKKNLPKAAKVGRRIVRVLFFENLRACVVALLKVYLVVFLYSGLFILALWSLAVVLALVGWVVMSDRRFPKIEAVLMRIDQAIFGPLVYISVVWVVLVVYFLYIAGVVAFVLTILTTFGESGGLWF